jgi:hypothetical protein
MRNAARLVTLTVCFALAGCPDRNPPLDGGTDAGRDAPSIDVRADVPVPGDTGPVDGGGDDTGMDDGGTGDGGTEDGGGPFCGDGITNGTEDCDLSDLGLNTCVTEGFDTGTLDCATDCTFDTAACRDFVCGDAMIEGTEVCDGTELGKNTCGSAGFDGGTLACAACALDTSGCTDCGDGTIEGTETCDGANLGGATCLSQGFISGSLTCSATCGYDTSACMSAPAPTAGQIVITEIMPNPAALNDGDGEWFEVRNTTAGPLQLGGCMFLDNQATPAMFPVTGSLIAPANGYLTFAIGATPGFTPSFDYPDTWSLAQAGDEVRLVCGTTLIDSVVYTSTWPFSSGFSMSLSPGSTTAAANDVQANWCRGAGIYNTVSTVSDEGTPGAANPACPVVTPEVCTGGVDEDGDTFIDCLDSDCTTNPACVVTTPEVCTGGIDEDGDTFIDCADSDCASSPACRTPSGALFFSEYIEGSSNNKAIEIWNDSTTARDLTGCSVRIYTNGNTTAGTTLNLTATVAAGDVFVICNSGASLFSDAPGGVCDIDSGVTNFNGNDALELVCGTATLDVIGQIGADPGTAWTGGSPETSTINQTLRRRCSVTGGDANGADAFDPSIQWSTFAIDTVADLGTGSCAP